MRQNAVSAGAYSAPQTRPQFGGKAAEGMERDRMGKGKGTERERDRRKKEREGNSKVRWEKEERGEGREREGWGGPHDAPAEPQTDIYADLQ